MKYIFDTSAFITLFRGGNYDRNVFTTLWEKFDGMVVGGDILSVRETRREINKRDDSLADWAKHNSALFHIPDQKQTKFVRELFENAHWQKLIKSRNIVAGNPVADPFIIALAHSMQGCVVTQEKEKPNAPCIPVICREYFIECENLIGFMTKEGWKF